MYIDNSDLRNVSFKLSEEECYININGYLDRNFSVCDNSDYTYQEKLNLRLKVSCELIEDIFSCDDILHIEKFEDVKKDIYVERKIYYRIFGKTVDSNNIPYKDVLVRVFKYNSYNGNIERTEIDKSFTNEYGEFNFVTKVNEHTDLNSYKVEIDAYYKSF
ncbi:MAG: hypothetical protein ACRCTZ_03325 [Sarcina sp.]